MPKCQLPMQSTFNLISWQAGNGPGNQLLAMYNTRTGSLATVWYCYLCPMAMAIFYLPCLSAAYNGSLSTVSMRCMIWSSYKGKFRDARKPTIDSHFEEKQRNSHIMMTAKLQNKCTCVSQSKQGDEMHFVNKDLALSSSTSSSSSSSSSSSTSSSTSSSYYFHIFCTIWRENCNQSVYKLHLISGIIVLRVH